MIRVTQGHEKGVGLEIFLKAFICLPKKNQKEITLYCDPESLKATLDACSIPFHLEKNALQILSSNLALAEIKKNMTQTSGALYAALEDMKSKDILMTLPSSKDQIFDRAGNAYKGHTDLFRSEFKQSEVVMTFLSPKLNVALLSDHISLGEVEKVLNAEKFIKVLTACLEGFRGVREIENVFVSGVNPHCGEGGIISAFDSQIDAAVVTANKKFPNFDIKGLFPGDTILFQPISKNNLFVFAFHDQGLAPFKLMNGLTGINLSLGLPFKRVSVDHGTAFDLYGKNQASYQGMLYLLDEILTWK